jgi:two-component system, NtrC family, nitrogen regulation sensor histidine kinase NtrY
MAETMKIPNLERRRIVEIAGIVAVTSILIGISRLETRLYSLSETMARDHSLLASIFYYGIINLNVFLAILLSLLVVRNIAKLLVERRHGVFGSQLRTKLVGVLIVFSLVPTVLVFYVSTRFITKSFDEWFGGRVKQTTLKTRDAGAQIYMQDQRRIEDIAKKVASRVHAPTASAFMGAKQVSIDLDTRSMEIEYGIQSIHVYDASGSLLGGDLTSSSWHDANKLGSSNVRAIMSRFVLEPSMTSASTVTVESGRDIVRAAVPVRGRTGEVAAIVVLEEKFDVPVLANIQIILDGLAALKPGAQLVRVSYLILVTVMSLLIIFAAVWFGFYVARAITGPLQLLAAATKEVALGNYTIKLSNPADDETGQLTKAFNAMTGDLARQKDDVESTRFRLEESNRELNKRRRYMEIVFENIASGVIAVDSRGIITAFNDAALDMLGVNEPGAIGKDIVDVLGRHLYDGLWALISDEKTSVARELDLREFGIDATVYVAASHIESANGERQGTVMVLDDATDRIRMQRATAWREVARRIAHEIKNPITPIRLSAERLLRRFVNRFDGEDRKVFENCVEAILVQVETLRGLVNEFSQFSRMPTIQIRPANLNNIISSAVEVFRQAYPAIHFTENYGPQPDAQLDPAQINRVIVNLLSNAIDAVLTTGRTGMISLVTRLDAAIEAIVIEISDNGPGIPEAIRDRVFEPYFSTKESGTGLGLAMVNQIVNDHGGYIRIAQSNENGTLVRIEIPLSGQVRV